uniref:Uncharacterized protein n=1 Tax=Macaca fascicularis TaxID=9541 RepID=A0A7N9DB62_MACFA
FFIACLLVQQCKAFSHEPCFSLSRLGHMNKNDDNTNCKVQASKCSQDWWTRLIFPHSLQTEQHIRLILPI